MTIIDIPLTTGMRQDTAQNTGGDGLWQATDVWMPQSGKIQVRGGFRCGTGDYISTVASDAGRNGPVRAVAEVENGVAIVGDNYVCRYEQFPGLDGYIHQSGGIVSPAACLIGSEVIPAQGYGSVAMRGSLVRVASTVGGPVRYVAQIGGVTYFRDNATSGTSDWANLVVSGNADDGTCCAAGNTTGDPVVVCVAASTNPIYSYGTIVNCPQTAGSTSSISGCCAGAVNHRTSATGGAIVVFYDNTSIRIYYCTTAGATLKVTYAVAAGIVSGRIAVDAVAKRLYVQVDRVTGYPTTGTVTLHRFDIPTDPTGSWAATPSVTTTRAYTGRLLEHDVTSDGSAILCVKSNGWTATTYYRVEALWYDGEAATTVTAWPWEASRTGPVIVPAFVLRSKLFSVQGYNGRFAFASPNVVIGEPSNAMLIVSTPVQTAGTEGFGTCSVSYVQQEAAPTGYLLQPVSDGVWISGALVRDGNVMNLHSVAVGTGVGGTADYALTASSYAFAPQVDASTGAVYANPLTSRSVATDGRHVVSSSVNQEMVGRSVSPGYSICYITALGKTAVSNACVAGTYQVKCAIEVSTSNGVWRGPPSLPVSIALAAGDRIDVGVIAVPLGWTRSDAVWRVLVYVAPPGSSTYYLQAAQEGYPLFAPSIQQMAVSIPTLDGALTTLNTASEILYDTTEPPRTYPGDAYGVAFAGNRFWRFRENYAWFTHAGLSGTVRQWCGDVFRIEFAGRVQGIGQSLGQPVVITDGAVYNLGGPGPDRNGVGSYEVRQINADPLGCLDQRSVCNIIPGLCWASNRGIELLPNGSSDITLISEPVREHIWDITSRTYPHPFVLGAHNQPRSTVLWSSGSAGSIVWDYLHNAWFTWATQDATAAGSFGGTFALSIYDGRAGASKARLACDSKGSVPSMYPLFLSDHTAYLADYEFSGYVETKPLRLSGINKAGSWRGVWILGGVGMQTDEASYTITQIADGTTQSSTTINSTGASAERAYFRAMQLFPVNTCDSSAVSVQMANAYDDSTTYGGNQQPMFLNTLTVEYDATGTASLLGSGVRS